MNRYLKFILILLGLIIIGLFYCKNKSCSQNQLQIRKNNMHEIENNLISTIKNYNDTILKNISNGIITVKIRSISTSKVGITIGYILNDSYFTDYKPSHFFYVDEILVIVKTNLKVLENYEGSIEFKKIDVELINKCKDKLGSKEKGYYTYTPIFWIFSYENKVLKVTKNNKILPPGYSIYE